MGSIVVSQTQLAADTNGAAGRVRNMTRSGSVSFDFYGLQIMVRSTDCDVLTDLTRDFSFFSIDGGEAAMVIEVVTKDLPRDQLPPLSATLHTPRNTVYRSGEKTFIDYFGRALAISEENGTRFRIHCEDRDMAHEVAYLTILSRVGQHLDNRAMHRVHALGVEVGGRAALVLLPMAGGKTTMALRLLREDGIHLLSEDSPLLTRNGEVLPFPLRIGVRPGGVPADVPQDMVRSVRRMEFGPKTLIDVLYFKDRLGARCRPGAILIGDRHLSGPSSIQPIGRFSSVMPMVRNSVVGLGLYQGMEFVLEHSGWEVLGKVGLALSRLRNSLAVIRHSRAFRFAMGPDIDHSASVLADFLHSMDGW